MMSYLSQMFLIWLFWARGLLTFLIWDPHERPCGRNGKSGSFKKLLWVPQNVVLWHPGHQPLQTCCFSTSETLWHHKEKGVVAVPSVQQCICHREGWEVWQDHSGKHRQGFLNQAPSCHLQSRRKDWNIWHQFYHPNGTARPVWSSSDDFIILMLLLSLRASPGWTYCQIYWG